MTQETDRHIEQKPVAELVPNPKNPRTHPALQVRQIIESIKEYGFNNPLLITSKNEVIAGHGRLQAVRKMGWDTVPAIVLDHLTPAQQAEYLIADNRIAETSGWDEALLVDQLMTLHDQGRDLTLLGYTEPELEELLIELTGGDSDEDLPPLDSGGRSEYQTMTFTFHRTQGEAVRTAVKMIKDAEDCGSAVNTNQNGNAIAWLCERYLADAAERDPE